MPCLVLGAVCGWLCIFWLRKSLGKSLLNAAFRPLGFVHRVEAPLMDSLLHLLNAPRFRVRDLDAIYRQRGDAVGFAAHLVNLPEQLDDEATPAATWLLLRAARAGHLDDLQVGRLLEWVDRSSPWVVRLNVCQILAITGCPRDARAHASDFLEHACKDARVIIRAWAISALSRFGNDPRHRAVFQRRLKVAQADSRKSMQARLRALGLAVKTTR